MQSVAKWGNSLAVRIPARLVKEMGLKEGDKVELSRASEAGLAVERQKPMTKAEALERIRLAQVVLPPDYKFNRDEANSRYHD